MTSLLPHGGSFCRLLSQSKSLRAVQVRAAAGIGSGLSLLQTSTPLQRNGNFCKNPTKPVPLRRLPSSSSDLVVELVVSELPFAACTRPEQLDLPQDLALLVDLETLHPTTLLPRLQQVQQWLASLPDKQRQAISSRPAFVGFLERGLELVVQRGMGPATPLLLLRVLSLLRFGGDEQLRDGYARFQRHVTSSLEDAAKRDPTGLGPQGVLGCYEAWAGMDLAAVPPKSSLIGVRLREYLRCGKLSKPECLRLLVAFAAIRRKSGGRFNPCNYDVSDVVSSLVHGIRGLGEGDLKQVAQACSAFDWPVYRSPVWALDCVAQEAIRRLNTQAMSLAAAEHLLGQAVEAARRIRPRMAAELEARVGQWGLQALAGAATLGTVQAMVSWAEAEEAASTLSNIVALSLAGQADLAAPATH